MKMKKNIKVAASAKNHKKTYKSQQKYISKNGKNERNSLYKQLHTDKFAAKTAKLGKKEKKRRMSNIEDIPDDIADIFDSKIGEELTEAICEQGFEDLDDEKFLAEEERQRAYLDEIEDVFYDEEILNDLSGIDDFVESDPLFEDAEILAKNIFLNLQKSSCPNISEYQKAKEQDETIRKVYETVGDYLSKYKSGSLPKAFKVLPCLKNWRDLLIITAPASWTPNSMFEATKIFVSNLNADDVCDFLSYILMPTVRRDINRRGKKLNPHYYAALKKAMYKPKAWFKSILLPLIIDGCSLRECLIIGSIIKKVSIPVLYASAAIMRICLLPDWRSTHSFFLSILLNKKYALPKKAADSTFQHFMNFEFDSRVLPVIWHKAVLIFLQRYKFELTDEQKVELNRLTNVQSHPLITPEIKKELLYRDPYVVLHQQQSLTA